MSKKAVKLSFATVAADGIAAWAFVAREDVDRVRGRFLHSACGTTHQGTGYAACLAVGSGLRWLLDHDRVGWRLAVEYPAGNDADHRAVNPAADASPTLAPMRQRIAAHAERFRPVDVRAVLRDDCGADRLARWGWESATLRLFPNRPTGRHLVPAMARAEATQ